MAGQVEIVCWGAGSLGRDRRGRIIPDELDGGAGNDVLVGAAALESQRPGLWRHSPALQGGQGRPTRRPCPRGWA